MNDDEVIKKLRSAKIKVVLYVSGLFLFLTLVDLYLANNSENITESMLSNSPFSIVIFVCLQLAIMLVFTYLEKILVGINKTKDSVSI
jgi:predicted Na+-dependent transporter